MSKIEYLSVEGLRIDGRRVNEVRDINIQCSTDCTFNSMEYDGMAQVIHGLNKVHVYVKGPIEERSIKILYAFENEEIMINMKNKSCATINDESVDIKCEILMSTEKKVKNIQHDRVTADLSNSIRSTFGQIIISHLYKRSAIEIFVNIIEADGSIKSTVLNAVGIALIDAGIAMKDIVTSCSVIYLDSTIMIDGNHMESTASSAELTLAVVLSTKKIVYMELRSKVPINNLEELVESCIVGSGEFGNIAKNKLRNNAYRILHVNEKIHHI